MHLNNIDGFTITPCRSSRYPAVQIGALVYADDIAINCDTIDQAQNIFLCLKMNASKFCLKINLKKRRSCMLDIILSQDQLQGKTDILSKSAMTFSILVSQLKCP